MMGQPITSAQVSPTGSKMSGQATPTAAKMGGQRMPPAQQGLGAPAFGPGIPGRQPQGMGTDGGGAMPAQTPSQAPNGGAPSPLNVQGNPATQIAASGGTTSTAGGLPVNTAALNYLNNWYAGMPAPYGAPAQSAATSPYQNNVDPVSRGPSAWDLRNMPPPAPTTASMQGGTAAPPPSTVPQQQNPNWAQLYGGSNQFAQGFNPLGQPMQNQYMTQGNTNVNPAALSAALRVPSSTV